MLASVSNFCWAEIPEQIVVATANSKKHEDAGWNPKVSKRLSVQERKVEDYPRDAVGSVRVRKKFRRRKLGSKVKRKKNES